MPFYDFENPETGEIASIFFHMNDEKKYVVNGVIWKRVYSVPQASIDTQYDPFKQSDYVKVTNKNGTMGDLWDKAAEMSEKRKSVAGIDPVRTEYYQDYSKKRGGLKHPQQRREEANKKLEKHGVKIE